MMYKCSNCGFASDFDFSIEIHEKFNHPTYPRKGIFECTDSNIEKHLCPEWDYDTHLKVDLEQHLRRGHDSNKKQFKFHEDLEIIEEQKCENCGFKTFSKYLWFVHITDDQTNKQQQSNNKVILKCLHCEYRTHLKTRLKTHMLYRHTADSKIKWFNCTQCSFKARTAKNLARHMQRKKRPKDKRPHFRCDQCEYKTYEERYLRDHKYLRHTPHDQMEWFDCAQCSHKAKRLSHLSAHIQKKHALDDKNKKRSFECDQCQFKTDDPRTLKRHKYRIHTPDDQINWVHCAQCSYKTKTKCYLATHVKVKHSNDANIKCDECEYRTTIKNNLRRHKLRIHKK